MSPKHQSIVRVLIVEDHELTRLTISLALSQHSNIKIVGLASNGKEAITMTNLYNPDVIIMDLEMPIMDGLTASTQIKNIAPHTYIIAYSSLEKVAIKISDRFKYIDYFCSKDMETKELINIINNVGCGAG
jgi:two-component system, NarL family, vancomycin resistance associated response regulator VraR